MGMSWKDLLNDGEEKVLPWFGFRKVHDAQRSWTISGPEPPEHGWYRFRTTGGRECTLVIKDQQPINDSWKQGQIVRYGYLVGNRIVFDAPVMYSIMGLDKALGQTFKVYCVELGLDRFCRAGVVGDRGGCLVFVGQEFPMGPEQAVIEAYQDRKESVRDIPGVVPALELVFRWASNQRQLYEERQRELQRLREEEERKRAEEERVRRLMKDAGTAIGRRALASRDFDAAAREALRVSGAELLDTRPSRNRKEMVVQYRFRQQRLECVVEKETLRVVDAGVCLTDHRTGVKGDQLFTLESLPGVIGEAIDNDKLVVWRHA